MLILPKNKVAEDHVEARRGMTFHFNHLMEQILNENSKLEKYWILGKTRVEIHNGKKVVRPFLQTCCEKPGLVRESFVYEVDNSRGTKTLLWVLHPNDVLDLPPLKKSIRVASKKGVRPPLLTGEQKTGV